jgi:ABC-type antimicrobial peptide transport system permease subunit
MALGAETSQVRRMVLSQGLRLVAVGLVIGTFAALGLARFLSSLLFGVQPWDPVVFIVVPLLLTATAVAAIWLPALRASRVNPIDALRME